MKNTVLKFALVGLITFGATSCKDNKNSAETTDAQDVAEADEMAMTYVVDTTSTILWKGEKPTGTHNGIVKISEGKVMVENDSVTAGNFTIDMNTIVSEDLEGEQKTNLEAHLKGTVEGKEGDFFNVTEYPDAMFELTSMEEKEGKTMVSGNLTLKDQTHNVTFPAMVSMNGNTMRIESEPFTIDRTKWGVNYGSKSVFDNLGDKFINDEIELTVKVSAQAAEEAM